MKEKFNTLSRKVKIIPLGDKQETDRIWKYIRDARYIQNKAYNFLISNIYAAYINKADKDIINDIYKRGQRNPKKDDSSYSLYNYDEFKFPKGLTVPSTVVQQVKADFSNGFKDIFTGKKSLPSRKLTSALYIESRFIKFVHEYESDEQLYNELMNKREPNFYLKLPNKIKCKIELGSPKKSNDLRISLMRIIKGEYKLQQSKIQIEGTKMYLHINIGIPAQNNNFNLDERVVVGVDLGLAIPATCALNTNSNDKLFIGSIDDFLRKRCQMQRQRKQLQQSLTVCSGGHGRKKKLKALDRLSAHEKNFAKTYNHKVSKQIIQFVLGKKAKYINIEDLSDFSKQETNQLFLRNWSYYQLQQFIIYKAKMYGIEVRKINPAYTSQTCSVCGYVCKENRKTQADFCCQKCGYHSNADFNAAKNIAMSTNFTK